MIVILCFADLEHEHFSHFESGNHHGDHPFRAAEVGSMGIPGEV